MNLKKIGKVFTSKFVGTGPSSYKKRIYRAAVSQRLRNTAVLYDTMYSTPHRVYKPMLDMTFIACLSKTVVGTVHHSLKLMFDLTRTAYIRHDLHLIVKLTLGMSSMHVKAYVGHDHRKLELVFHVTSTRVKAYVGHDHSRLKLVFHVC